MEGEKKINERINKVEEMIKRARKMKDLMNYQRRDWLHKVQFEDVYEGHAAPRSN